MTLLSKTTAYVRIGLAVAAAVAAAVVLVSTTAMPAGAQSEEESEIFYECPDDSWHAVGTNCVRALADEFEELPYTPAVAAIPAVSAVDPVCPTGYAADAVPPTNCFVNVSTAAAFNAQTGAGADCATATVHANGSAKGFCSVQPIGGSPAVAAVAAVPAMCDGAPTTRPASECFTTVAGGDEVIPATAAATATRSLCLDGGTRTGETCTLKLDDTIEQLPYVPAVAAVAGIADRCPGNTTGDDTPPTKCFITVTSTATLAAAEAVGADCSSAIAHSNGTAKGFCTRPVIVGTPAVEAQPATCDGVATTQPRSFCTRTVSNELVYDTTPFVHSCADGTAVTVVGSTFNCVGQQPSTFVDLPYTPGKPAVPAVPGTPAQCPTSTFPDGVPPQKCFVNVSTVAERNAFINFGFDCDSSIGHANGTAKGFCQTAPTPGEPGTPAIAAVAATCNGFPTFAPESECVTEVPGGDIQVPAEFMARGVTHTVSCLAGNGRVDTNIVNDGPLDATYRVEFEGLNARQRLVPGTEWWRVPITGRFDGSYDIVVKRNGTEISRQSVTVACDVEDPAVGRYEARVINACLGGNGYILFQMANTTDASRSWVVEFGSLNNRSTSAAAYGAAVRAVSGRPDGDHDYTVRVGSTVVRTGTVTVACD